MPTRRLLLAALAIGLVAGGAPPAAAFRACTQASPPPSGHWPDPRNSSSAGSRKWEFDWQIVLEGIEISNVRYTSDLAQPKKLVLSRASLPFLPVHYPDSPPDCPGIAGPHGYSDVLASYTLDTANPFCCREVPITVCNLADRAQACNPLTGTVGKCPKSAIRSRTVGTWPDGAISCGGACVGTQTPVSVEVGTGETASQSSSADILVSAIFRLGGYQFVQRWRFQDNGTIRPSLRAGGIHQCQWHNHQIYWRFHFQLADGVTPAATVQQCDPRGPGGCPDTGAPGWSTITCATCGNRPAGIASWWRIGDNGVPGRAAIIQTNTAEAADDPSAFCENTTSECGPGGCVNARDFCALGAAEPHETFVTDNCNDHLPDASSPPPSCSGLSDVAFWYFAHVNHHDPCTFLPLCDPTLGTLAFGPTIRLVGSW
jgi:hypothetical protein